MRSATASVGSWRLLLRRLPGLALLLAVVAVLLLVLVPLGWRAGWWGLRASLLGLMGYAAYCGIAAVVAAVIALVLGARASGRRGAALAVVALIVGGLVVYVPWHFRALARSVPPIDDITTDTTNPPPFAASVAAARAAARENPAAYGGARIAALQKRGYPDLAPLMLAAAPGKAFALTLATARREGWTILAADPKAGRIEATARSFWMGFIDDIAVRVAAAGAGSRIDMRSASRLGRSDLGVNAARIRAYFAALRARAKAVGDP
ncbi:MAG: DUF1499 domain-containing protein [Stellaceae bacterium]